MNFPGSILRRTSFVVLYESDHPLAGSSANHLTGYAFASGPPDRSITMYRLHWLEVSSSSASVDSPSPPSAFTSSVNSSVCAIASSEESPSRDCADESIPIKTEATFVFPTSVVGNSVPIAETSVVPSSTSLFLTSLTSVTYDDSTSSSVGMCVCSLLAYGSIPFD